MGDIAGRSRPQSTPKREARASQSKSVILVQVVPNQRVIMTCLLQLICVSALVTVLQGLGIEQMQQNTEPTKRLWFGKRSNEKEELAKRLWFGKRGDANEKMAKRLWFGKRSDETKEMAKRLWFGKRCDENEEMAKRLWFGKRSDEADSTGEKRGLWGKRQDGQEVPEQPGQVKE